MIDTPQHNKDKKSEILFNLINGYSIAKLSKEQLKEINRHDIAELSTEQLLQETVHNLIQEGANPNYTIEEKLDNNQTQNISIFHKILQNMKYFDEQLQSFLDKNNTIAKELKTLFNKNNAIAETLVENGANFNNTDYYKKEYIKNKIENYDEYEIHNKQFKKALSKYLNLIKPLLDKDKILKGKNQYSELQYYILFLNPSIVQFLLEVSIKNKNKIKSNILLDLLPALSSGIQSFKQTKDISKAQIEQIEKNFEEILYIFFEKQLQQIHNSIEEDINNSDDIQEFIMNVYLVSKISEKLNLKFDSTKLLTDLIRNIKNLNDILIPTEKIKSNINFYNNTYNNTQNNEIDVTFDIDKIFGKENKPNYSLLEYSILICNPKIVEDLLIVKDSLNESLVEANNLSKLLTLSVKIAETTKVPLKESVEIAETTKVPLKESVEIAKTTKVPPKEKDQEQIINTLVKYIILDNHKKNKLYSTNLEFIKDNKNYNIPKDIKNYVEKCNNEISKIIDNPKKEIQELLFKPQNELNENYKKNITQKKIHQIEKKYPIYGNLISHKYTNIPNPNNLIQKSRFKFKAIAILSILVVAFTLLYTLSPKEYYPKITSAAIVFFIAFSTFIGYSLYNSQERTNNTPNPTLEQTISQSNNNTTTIPSNTL